jgi:hypothetical protein
MKKFFLCCTLCILSFSFLNAQILDSMIKVYSEQVPEQKAYVHFDKDVYLQGETIWFKAYLFSGFSLADISKNFYAELINDKGLVVQRKVYPIIEAAAAGNFDIPDTLPSGNFIYRGYTTWMLNFDTSFIYQKNILIVDKNETADNKKASVPAAGKTTLIQFFPEGGHLVNTLESVVAFKANDERGMPVPVKGKIVNSKGAVVANFSAQHDGMGTFLLTPAAGETYQAIWTDASGKQQTTNLPEAKMQGCVIKISPSGNKKLFLISRTADVPPEWKNVNVVALLGQERVYKAKANLETVTVTSGAIPVGDFPSGIMRITLFSNQWEPIAERIIMVNNDNYRFDAELNAPEVNTNFRGKNSLEINVDDTLLSNLSVSVTDAAIGRQQYGDNIYSRILMTGDIKDFVYNPAYYFSNTSDSVASHLDLVMLTHGWRRYNWASLARGRKPLLKYPAESFLTIEARVFGVTTASPLRNDEEIGVFLQQKDSSYQFIQMQKTGVDKFSAQNIVFYDTASLHYQFMKTRKPKKK